MYKLSLDDRGRGEELGSMGGIVGNRCDASPKMRIRRKGLVESEVQRVSCDVWW